MPKKRKCCGCKEYHPAESGFLTPAGFFHSTECASTYASEKAQKARNRDIKRTQEKERKKHNAKKREIKKQDIRHQHKLTQQVFNKYIRLRDVGKPCISCGRANDNTIQFHAGHFLTVGARPEHRYNEINCHAQCVRCNNFLSGNVAEYRKNLIDLIGLDIVESLENDRKTHIYTPDELIAIRKKYSEKVRQLEK